jgi:hypothetical protein
VQYIETQYTVCPFAVRLCSGGVPLQLPEPPLIGAMSAIGYRLSASMGIFYSSASLRPSQLPTPLSCGLMHATASNGWGGLWCGIGSQVYHCSPMLTSTNLHDPLLCFVQDPLRSPHCDASADPGGSSPPLRTFLFEKKPNTRPDFFFFKLHVFDPWIASPSAVSRCTSSPHPPQSRNPRTVVLSVGS